MIVAAALCPAPPLLVRELTGADPVAPELRSACLAAAAELIAAAPEVIAVVGAAEQTRTWDGSRMFDPAVFAPGVRPPGRGDPRAGDLPPPADLPPADLPPADLPPAVGVGAWLLSQAGYRGERILQSVADREPAGRCADVGAGLAAARGRVALLVMADGSARRTLKAPGYLDDRSAGFDAGVEQALRSGRLDALLAIDPDLARVLMATGRPAWQVLAGAAAGRRVCTEVRYRDDPFGVAYLVASMRMPGGE